MDQPITHRTPESTSRQKWLIVALVFAAAGFMIWWLLAGDSGSGRRVTGETTQPGLLVADDVAGVLGVPVDSVRSTNPPIDVAEAERRIARMPLVDAPLPADRSVVTYAVPARGQEVTHAVLFYAHPDAAVQLINTAEQLIPLAAPLEPIAIELDGVDEARRWVAAGYEAITFRHGTFVEFVGASGASPEEVQRLAEIAVAKVPDLAKRTTPDAPEQGG